MGLLWPKCRTQHLALLKLIQLALAHRSSLSDSSAEPSYPQADWHSPPNLVSSANLLSTPSPHLDHW